MKLKKNSTLLTIVLKVTLLSSMSSYACDIKGISGIVPENNLKIPVGLKALTGGGISEASFNKVIDKVTKIYAPVVKQKGATLQVVKKWTDGTVNAYAHREGNIWYVSMFGGLARIQRGQGWRLFSPAA